MRPSLLEFLCCPDCGADLTLKSDTMQRGEVEAGWLACEKCGGQWPIDRGVPDFVTRGRSSVEQTTSGFARNWRVYNDVIRAHEHLNDDLLREWILPVEPARFDGRVVLDAGCGMGRWSSVAARYRPRALLAFDYSDIVHTAHANLHMLPYVHVLRADLFRPPLRRKVDIAYCIGVLHHTPDAGAGYDSLCRLLTDGGALVTWTYGAENNEWITRFVDPLRKHVTSHMPHLALLGISKLLAHNLYLAATVYERLPENLPLFYADYVRHLKRYPRPYMEHIVYDHLIPQISHYIPREEVESWAKRNGLRYRISARNGNSWRLLAARDEATLTWLSDPEAPEPTR